VTVPCQFCVERRLSKPCVKRWGPKREADLKPTQSVSVYDSFIHPNDVQTLQFIYSHDITWFDFRATTSDLFKKLAFYYGPAIGHRGLRFAMLACGGRERSAQKSPTVQELEYVGHALKALTLKLVNPATIDEGDLFGAAILALWSMRVGEKEKFDLAE